MDRRAAVSAILRVSALSAMLALGCSGAFLVPNPPAAASGEAPGSGGGEPPLPERSVTTSEFDFSKAFDDGESPRDTSAGVLGAAPAQAVYSLRYPPIRLQKRLVRVMVRQGVNEAAVYSSATAHLRTGKGSTTFRGRMHVEALYGGTSASATVGRAKKEIRLPCTLYVSSAGANLLELGESSYRGALVITPEEGGGISFVNMLDMEDYLRGVVPLEIGNLKDRDIEAVKAQAVAARTYAYRKMAQREAGAYDLTHTVSDQVYGGANAEAAVSDMAVRLTKDLVMAYNDGLVNAYYHSTCGGRTANIEDVWGGEAYPYLRSVSDAAPDGSAYCGESSSFSWTERWSAAKLTGIIRRFSAEGNLNPPFGGGALRSVEVRERFECGRVKALSVVSGAGEHVTGGDRARFLLRRDGATYQVLRSAKFNSARVSGGEVVIAGGGYGHGIGMCQVGAIGRARAGQDFERILRAYYSGISIRAAAPE